MQWLIGCNGSSVATAVRSPVNENVLGLKKCSEPLPWDGLLGTLNEVCIETSKH